MARSPTPMTAAQRAQKLREHVTYPSGQFPWRAHGMFGPALTGYDLSYRGQKPAVSMRN